MEPDYCFHYARLTEAIFLQTTTCCWAQSYCSVTLGYKGLFISHVPHLLWSTTCPLTWWWEDLWGCPAATAGISLLRIKNRTMWKFWFNMTTTCDPHYTSILQRQKSTKCHNWDINSVGSPQLLLISPRLNWALPELAQETTSFLQNSKEKFKLHYCVCLVPVQELFLFEGFGNLPKQGQSLGCSSQACAQSHYTTLPLPPLKATCALGILLVFVDHMHQWPLHHLHFTASQLRPILPGSDGTHWIPIFLAAQPKGSFTGPFPPQQIRLDSAGCRETHRTAWSTKPMGWCAGTRCHTATCPGHQESGNWGCE